MDMDNARTSKIFKLLESTQEWQTLNHCSAKNKVNRKTNDDSNNENKNYNVVRIDTEKTLEQQQGNKEFVDIMLDDDIIILPLNEAVNSLNMECSFPQILDHDYCVAVNNQNDQRNPETAYSMTENLEISEENNVDDIIVLGMEIVNEEMNNISMIENLEILEKNVDDDITASEMKR